MKKINLIDNLNLESPISKLYLSREVEKLLYDRNITTIGKLIKLGENGIKKLAGIDCSIYREIITELELIGFTFPKKQNKCNLNTKLNKLYFPLTFKLYLKDLDINIVQDLKKLNTIPVKKDVLNTLDWYLQREGINTIFNSILLEEDYLCR